LSQSTNRASGGHIPNFADPLKQAIGREMAAGVPSSQIYIDKSSSLKSAANPMGLMVANRRDEPMGGHQGVSRAIKEGRNPKTYGAAGGFVPNYAAGASGPDLSPFVGKTVPEATKKIQEDLKTALSNITKQYQAQLEDVKKNSQQIDEKIKIETETLKVERQALAERLKNLRKAQKNSTNSPQDLLAINNLRDDAINRKESIKQRTANLQQITPIDINQERKNLRESALKQRAEERTNTAALTTAVSANAKRGLTNPITPKVVDPNAQKGSRDMLGTIFALQGAMSVLTGATSDATSKLGKSFNILAESASTVTTALFALQGLQSIAGPIGSIATKLGPWGIGLAATFGVMQASGKIYDELSGINKSAAESMDRVAQAAKDAAVKLEDLSDFQQKSTKTRAESLVSGASQEASLAKSFFTGPTVNYEGWDLFTSGELQKSLDSMASSALAAGVSYDQMFNMIRSKAQDGEMSKKDVEDLSLEISKLIPTAKKVSQEINALNLNPFQGFGAELANISNVDLDKTLKEIELNNKSGDTDNRFAEIRNALYRGGMIDTVGEGAQLKIKQIKENLDSVKNQKIIDTDNAKNSIKSLDAINTSLQKTKEYILDLQSQSFKFTNIISAFKGISEAAIENAYNFSEYEKSIQKLNISIEGIKASSAISKLNLIAETTDKLRERAKSSNTVGSSINIELLDQIAAAISSGKDIKDLIDKNNQSIVETFGTDYPKFIQDTTEEFQKQKKEINKQSEAEENNLRIETHRSLVAQQTTAALENQNKQLELQQNSAEKIFQYSEKIRNSRNKISDLTFERSVIGKTQIERLRAENTRGPELRQRAVDEAKFNFKQENIQSVQGLQSLIPSTLSAESQFKLKNEILNATGSIRSNQGGLEQISETAKKAYDDIIKAINESVQNESKSRQDTITKLQDTLVGSTVTFSNSVISAAKEFNKIVTEAAREPERQNLRSEISQTEINQGKDRETLQRLKIEAARIFDLKDIDRTPLQDTEFARKDAVNSRIADLETQINSNEVNIQRLRNQLNELNTSVELPVQMASDTSKFAAQLMELINIKPTIASSIPPLIARPTPTQAPAISPLEPQNPVQEGLDVAKKDLEATLLEISNAEDNRSDEIEKQTSITRILTDRFKELRNSVPANIADLISQKNRSISGSEISKLNYDIETQRQLAGAGTREEQDKIIRDRQNKPLSQLFDERFSKTSEELSMNLKNTLVDGSEQFKNNLIDGITQAVESGASLSDILQNAALEFARSMTKASLTNIFDSVGSAFSGIAGFASGGKVTGGSGNKDDVPAMLMGGEFVMTKKAVQKYGPDFLNALNSGSIGGYAKGGPVQKGPQGNFYTPGQYGQGAIMGSKNLLDFATQSYTTGKRDEIINSGNFASINLEAESARLTNFGRQNGPAADALRSAKGEAFSLYLTDYQQKQEAQKQEKEKKKALRNQLIMAGISLVGGAVISSAATGFGNAYNVASQSAKGFSGFLSSVGAGAKGIWSGYNGYGGLSNIFSGEGFTKYAGSALPVSQLDQSMNSVSTGSSFANSQSYDQGFNPTDALSYANSLTRGRPNDIPGIGINGSLFKEQNLSNDDEFLYNNSFLPPRKQATGGMIPPTSGIDTVSTMLSGGEFVMNRAAAQNIGAGNLQSLNSGAKSLPTEEKSEELNDRLISKLDELIEASGAAGNITINVEGGSGKSSETSDGKSAEGKQQLARQIRDAVLKVIQEEKRLGGQLRRGM
jgi:hypothetical protein